MRNEKYVVCLTFRGDEGLVGAIYGGTVQRDARMIPENVASSTATEK